MAWYDFVYDWVLEKLKPLWNWTYDIWDKLWALYYDARDYAYSLYEGVWDYAYSLYRKAKTYADSLLEDIEDFIPRYIIDAANSVRNWWADVTDFVNREIRDVKSWSTTQWQELKDFYDALKGNVTNFPEYIKGLFAEAWEVFKATIEFVVPQFVLDAVNWISEAGIKINDWMEQEAKPMLKSWADFQLTPEILVQKAISFLINKFTEKEEDIKKEWETTRTSLEE